MYVLFFSFKSQKSQEIINNMDENSRKIIKLVSIDTPKIYDFAKKYIKEVPCLVIKEEGKIFMYEYDILLDLYKPPEPEIKETPKENLAFSDDPNIVNNKTNNKVNMSSVQDEIKRRQDELDNENRKLNPYKYKKEKEEMEKFQKTAATMVQQYTSAPTQTPTPNSSQISAPKSQPTQTSISNQYNQNSDKPVKNDIIQDFFNFNVSSDL
jgi:hypothetical protein